MQVGSMNATDCKNICFCKRAASLAGELTTFCTKSHAVFKNLKYDNSNALILD